MCYCPTPTLHLNLALTGDGAFLFSLKKTHSVWFISVLKYGDTENVLINHLLLVIPMSYPCHYTICVLINHINMPRHTHTHTHTHTHSTFLFQLYSLLNVEMYTTVDSIKHFIYMVFFPPKTSLKSFSFLIHFLVLRQLWHIHSLAKLIDPETCPSPSIIVKG